MPTKEEQEAAELAAKAEQDKAAKEAEEKAAKEAEEKAAREAEDPKMLKAELEKARSALKERNKEEAARRKKLEELEAAEEGRKKAAMTESEKAAARIKELEALAAEKDNQIKQAERRELQRKVAKEVGIPEVFASRIAGDTEEDMTADAKTILEALPKPEAEPKDKKKAPVLIPTNPANGQKGETEAQAKARIFGPPSGPFDTGTVSFVEKD